MTSREDIAAARERLAAARTCLAGRRHEQTLESLGSLLDAWSEPGSPWQKRLVDELPGASGFSAANVREGLALGLAGFTGAALRKLVDRELGALGEKVLASGYDQTSVVLAGSIPMPTLSSLLMPLVLHSPVLAKTASRDPVTAHVFRESLAEVDPELATALEIVSFPGSDDICGESFVDAGCVVATGSDQTMAEIAGMVRGGTRLVSYGHRVSIAVLGPDTIAAEVAADLACDVALWDQLGCLSPVAVFCVGGDADRLAAELATELERNEKRTPRGEISTAAAAAIRAERDGAEMRRAAGAKVTLRGDDSLRFTVILEDESGLRPAPLHRFVRVHPTRDRDELYDAVRPLSQHLAGVALAGFGSRRDDVVRELAQLGASRICPPGRLQTPPLGWHHDNQPLLLPLARIADLEA